MYKKKEILDVLGSYVFPYNVQEENEFKLGQIDDKSCSDKFQSFVRTQSLEAGGRNHSVMIIAREGLALGVSINEIESTIRAYCKSSGISIEEGLNVLKYQVQYHKEKPFVSFIDNFSTQENLELAKTILKFYCCPITKERTFCTVKGVLHRYVEGKYERVEEENFKILVRTFLNKNPKIKVSKNKIQEIIEHIKAETFYTGKGVMNFFINQITTDRYLVMMNNILNLTKAMNGITEVIANSPKFFSTSKLSYDFSTDADCPKFRNILNRVLPDSDDQKMLQLWFGYHLLETVSYGKLMMMIGSGANGKSVILKVLRLFLGNGNVSAVPIENFNTVRTFALAETYGKLANIYDEMTSTEIDEATVKNYVTGGQTQAERKYAHPFTFIPTAKLTFSSNVIPAIKDRTDGFWRRVLILVCKVKIPSEEQNPDFIEDEFWIESGELSGVFNWALEGAKDVVNSRKFFESQNSKSAVARTKIEADSARLWISENIVIHQGLFLNRTIAYNLYKQSILNQGQKPCSAKDFFLEIVSAFPGAVIMENPISLNGVRCRGWFNLICTANTINF